jgi:hypothetical protein
VQDNKNIYPAPFFYLKYRQEERNSRKLFLSCRRHQAQSDSSLTLESAGFSGGRLTGTSVMAQGSATRLCIDG